MSETTENQTLPEDYRLAFRNESRLFKLEQNYRSTQLIVQAANSLIKITNSFVLIDHHHSYWLIRDKGINFSCIQSQNELRT